MKEEREEERGTETETGREGGGRGGREGRRRQRAKHNERGCGVETAWLTLPPVEGHRIVLNQRDYRPRPPPHRHL